MSKSISCIWICLLLLSFSSNLIAQGQSQQQYDFEFRGIPLAHALDKIAIETGIDMAYDPVLVKDITVYQRIQGQQVKDILQRILSDTPLDFLTLSSGTIVIVKTVHEDPAYGSFYGKVVDQKTGDPLPGASVMLADASGGTSTSESGNFSINRLVSGKYKIIFSYIGYKPLQKTVEIHPNQDLQQQVALEPKPVDFTPIVVTGHVPQMPFNRNQGDVIAADSEWEPNGRLQNAIHSLSLLPGVQYGLPMTDLHLQGGQGGEHRILLDGVPIYNPYSFGKMFSAFSPHAISKVELHKAGYGVPQGSQIAGLVNLKHDLDNPKQPSAVLQVDPLSLNGRADLQLTTSSDSSTLDIMTAGRTNYWDYYQDPSLKQTLQEWDALDPLVTNLLIDSDADASLYQPREHHSDVRFYDFHLASRYKFDPYRVVSASFYAGGNSVSTDLLRQAPQNEELPQYLYAQDLYQWQNTMGQVTYDHFISSRLDMRSQLSFSSNRFSHSYRIGTNENPDLPELNMGPGDVSSNLVYDAFSESAVQSRIPTQRNANRIQHITFRTGGTYSFTPKFNLEGGLQLDIVKSRVDLSDLFYLRTLSDQQSTFLSNYLNGNWRMGVYWKLTAGNRLTLVEPMGKVYSEPRASLQYDRPESSIGYWSARLSGGLYRQFINQFDITNPGPTSLVPSIAVWSHAGSSKVPEAWHLSSSFHLEPSSTTSLKLEGFYKWQPTTYIASYENLLQGSTINRSDFNAFAEATEMKSLGAGFRVHQALMETKVKLMAGYDYSYNRINLDKQFGRSMPAPWNEPHRFQFRVLGRLLPAFSTVVKWQTVLGRTWGFRQAYYNFLFYEGGQNFGQYSFGKPEDDTLSPYHQLDVSLIYAPAFNSFGMEIRLDLINLLDQQNTIDWSLQPTEPGGDQYQKSERTMPGFMPSLSIKIEY